MKLKFSNLNVDESTEAEIVSELKSDYHVYVAMQREMLKLQNTRKQKISQEEPSEVILNADEEDNVRTDVDSEFERAVDYYYCKVKKIDDSNLESDLIEALPSPDDYQYKKLLLRIKAEIMRDIIFIKALLSDETVSNEDVQAFSADIDLKFKKIDIISELLNVEEIEICDETIEKNNLILLPTLSGNIRIIEDISNIDIEYYDRFYEMLKSMEYGGFRFKRFIEHKELVGLCEVKGFKTRVLFRRLDANTYVIIGAFIKKTDSDSLYRNTVIAYHDLYKKMENWLHSNLNNPDFLEAQEMYKNELFNMLQSKKSASKELKMGGI